MALTLEQLIARRDAILGSLGITSLQLGDKQLTYGRDEEKVRALKALDAEIAALQSPQARQFTIQTNRGI